MIGAALVRMDNFGHVRFTFSNKDEALQMLFPEEYRLRILASIDHDLLDDISDNFEGVE